MQDPMNVFFETQGCGLKIPYPKDGDFALKVGWALWTLHMNDLATGREIADIKQRFFKKVKEVKK